MPQGRYQRIPTTEADADDTDVQVDSSVNVDTDDQTQIRRTRLEVTDDHDRPLRASVHAEFNRQPPAWWKRALLIAALIGLGWLSLKLAKGNPKPQVIYANRSVSLIPSSHNFPHHHSKSP